MNHICILTHNVHYIPSTTLKPSISPFLFLELMIRLKSLRVANVAVGNPCWSNPISNCAKQILLTPPETDVEVLSVVVLKPQSSGLCRSVLLSRKLNFTPLKTRSPSTREAETLHHWYGPCPAKSSYLTTYALFLAQRWHSVFQFKLCTKDWYREEM
jgi:hypothetical protein